MILSTVCRIAIAGSGLVLLLAIAASAQTSNLMLRATPDGRPQLPPQLDNLSLYYRAVPAPRKLAVNDIIFINVRERATMTAEADVQRRKNSLYDAVLEDFPILDGLRWIKPSPQSNGDPRARGQVNQTFRAENALESRESLQLRIAARVADVRPNGNLVLEAHKSIKINNETWEVSLSGICNPQDVDPSRTIESEKIVDMQVRKRERGHVRDSVRRGWFMRFLDRFVPF